MLLRAVLMGAICVFAMEAAEAREILVADQTEYKAAVKSAKPGDSIVLRDGEWRDAQLVFTGTGTAEAPITLTAQTKGKVLLTGASNLRLGGRHLVVSGLVFKRGASPTREVISFRRDSKMLASNTRITEVVIDGFSKPDRRSEDIWVAIYGTDNRVDHSHFEGKTNSGVTLAVIRKSGDPLDNRHRIDHNYFGPRPPLGSNGGETIRIGTSEESLSDSHTVVERNIFDRTSGEVEIVSVKSGGNILRENLVLSSQGAFVLRHGNGNLVERNIFLGNHVPDSGGIRVINRDQVIRFNYLEGLAGKDFKSALTVMNGVPNSVINRYHQVSNALIERNSILDSARITLAAGADAERSAPPVESQFKGNLVSGTKNTDPFRAEDDIGGITFSGNVEAAVAQPLVTRGVEQRELRFERAANGLLYPTDPALAKVGAPRDLVPVKREEVGASWYRPDAAEADFGSGRTVELAAGASLADAVGASRAGDRLALAGGAYEVVSPVVVRHRLTIAGQAGAAPVVHVASGAFARIEAGGGLRLADLTLDARGASADAALIAVAPGVAPNYEIEMKGVSVRGPGKAARLDGIVMAPGTFANAIALLGSSFSDMSGAVVLGTGEQEPKGWYPVERLEIAGSSFARVGLVADLLRKGTDESTFGPYFSMTGSSVSDSGAGDASLRLSGAQHSEILGNSFETSAPLVVIHSVGKPHTRISGNAFRATPAPRIEELVYKGPLRAELAGNLMDSRP